MSFEPQKSAYAVIPAYILFNTELSDGDKILYGHISNLASMYGFCWASNGYLTELTGKSLATIKRSVKALQDLDLIRIEHVENGDQDQRKIFLAPIDFLQRGGSSKMSQGELKNETPGGSKMSHIISKEEYSKKNKLKEPPPPTSSTGGGGGLSSSSLIVGDWTYRNVRGEAVSLTQSQIFRHFVRLSFTTEILQEAIKQAMGSNELIGCPWKYLEAICFRLTQEKKNEASKIQPQQDLPSKNTEPKINFLEAMKARNKKQGEKNGI